MGTQKIFRLELLSDEDSWELFEKIAGQDIKLITTNNYGSALDEINSIVENVPKCCNGLPLFIVVVAKALRTKDLSTWKDALKQLKGLNEKGNFKEVVCPLELGYRYLKSNELRTLLLSIVSLGPGRIHTGELFSCYWGLYGDSYELTKARNKYYKLIDDLRASSFLIEVEVEYVRMHDSVRDTAKAISSRTHLTYEVPNFTHKEQWDIDQLKKCHYINFPSYNLDELPEKLDCPELKLMSLKSNLGHLTIPDNFFVGMGEVKVLNLHRMNFAPSPPPSFRLLTNLRSLNLYECVLDDITIVAELTNLEIVSLERSKIQELPKDIGQLAYLRMLNLTNCCQLKTIPKNLISSLTCLEELYMGNCNIQWEGEGGESQTNHASLGELRNLNQLTTLDLSIHDASVLPADMDVFKQLQRYNISIGNMWKWSSLWSGDAREISRTLKLVDSLNTLIFLNRGVQMLFTTIEELSLGKLNFVDDVSYQLNTEAFQNLRHLYVQNSDAFRNLETLILCNLRDMYGPLAKQTLLLCNLRVMEDISYGPLATQCFEKLQVFKVQDCYKLKKLLSYSIAKNLSQLQEIEIVNCTAMEEIVYEEILEDENMHNIKYNATLCFEKLQVIKVHHCHKLKKLLPYSLAKSLSKLQELEIFDCSDMEEIIYEEKLEIENLHNMKDFGTHCFQKLQVIKVQGCHKLKKLLPYSFAENLSQLQEMEILNCTVMEEIISEEKLEDENLHNMKDIGIHPFEKLQVINVQSCHKLKKLLPYALAKNLPQLQEMKIFQCKVLEEIISEEKLEDGKEFSKIMLPKLRSLTLNTLPKLRSFSLPLEINKDDGSIPLPLFNQKVSSPKLDMLVIINLNCLNSIWYNQQTPNSVSNLKEIKITGCHALHHVFPTAVAKELLQLQVLEISTSKIEMIVEDNNIQHAPDEITLPKLEQLKLEYLPRLTKFCKESYNLKFPSLKTVEIIGCNLKSSGHVDLTTRTELEWGGKNGQKDNELNLFNEKVAMPNLENLKLSNIGSYGKIWDEKLRVPFHSKNLKDLIADDYLNHTESLFSSSTARELTKLKHLEILSCPALTEIFVQQEKVTFPNLETLFINGMNGLNSIWNNFQGPNSFHKLNKIQIIGCRSLHHVFPVVVAKELQQLQVLQISRSSNIENIVVKSLSGGALRKHKNNSDAVYMPFKENKGDNAYEIVFMNLKELYLEHLLRLGSFCEESYNFRFLALEKVRVIRCPNMKTFCYGNVSAPCLSNVRFGWTENLRWDGDLNTTVQRVFKRMEIESKT
ncbi:hypothetical protein ACSQ67_010184 [Phaseolus vulgaris]